MPENAEQWFEVTAQVKVRAETEDAAIKRVSAMLTSNQSPLYPVGIFNAARCADPARRPQARTLR